MQLLNQQYGGHSHGHRIAHVAMASDGPDFAAICDGIAQQLYSAKIDQGQIPRDLYEATANTLMDAVFSGTGGRKSFAYEDPNNLLVPHLRHNIYAFGAAKSLTEMQVFNDLLVDKDGKNKSKAQYRADVAKAGYQFNMNHLEADQSTALASTQIAQTFNEFGADDYIEVRTTGAENVCPICGSLNGFTRPKSSNIWERFCPPFHQRCNCKLLPGLAKNVAKHDNPLQMLKDAKVQTYFQSNPAINKVVFTDGYPYMATLKKNMPLRWDKGYNMQTIDRIYKDKLPDTLPEMTKQQANDWWKQQAGTPKGAFYVKDKLGTVCKLDNQTRNHVFEQNKEDRFKFISNLPDILQDPDEMWSTKGKSGKLTTTYIKYYNDLPYSAQTEDNRVFTMIKYNISGTEKLNEVSVNNDRQGTLVFRK